MKIVPVIKCRDLETSVQFYTEVLDFERRWAGCEDDAEAHYTQNGTLVVTLSVATKETWKDTAGDWQSRTDWHRTVSFDKQAEFARTLPKGSYVIVQGTLRAREYEREGAKHRIVEVRADTMASLIARRADLKPKASLIQAMPERMECEAVSPEAASTKVGSQHLRWAQ